MDLLLFNVTNRYSITKSDRTHYKSTKHRHGMFLLMAIERAQITYAPGKGIQSNPLSPSPTITPYFQYQENYPLRGSTKRLRTYTS